MLVTLTSEIQTEYSFSVKFFKDKSELSPNVPTWVAAVFNVALVGYLGNLVKSIQPPQTEFQFDNVKLNSILNYPVFKGINLSPFQVTFLDDSLGFVSKFFQVLQDYALGFGSFQLRPILNVTMGMAYIQNVKNSITLGGLVPVLPTHIEYYPRIFPAVVSRSQMDKGGEGFQTITVTFIRIPKIMKE